MANDETHKYETDFAKPTFEGGIFGNPKSFKSWINPPSFSSAASWANLCRWIFCEKNMAKIPKDKKELQRTLPVHKPVFPVNSKLGATWLGHATVFVQIGGLSLLTDPVWAEYASPLSWIFFRRYRPPPCSIEELPKIDIVVISHNHFDHLDHKAVKELASKFPKIQWFVPKGLADWMRAAIGSDATIHALNWGENVEMELADKKKFKIWSIPAQHWSQRNMLDRFKTLWCGWLIQGPEHKFFFTGDTGFCDDEFGKVGKRFGPVDLCAIPIGCYAPRWFMRPQHIDPDEAVQIHQLCRAKKSIAIHWGTYEMGSCEPYMEPVEKLREEVEKKGLSPDEFIALEHGQTWKLE